MQPDTLDPTGAEQLDETESINLATYEAYFKQCAVSRESLTNIHCVVPVRPGDGMNCKLTRMLSVWYGEGTGWSHLNDHMGGFIEVSRANIAYDFVKNRTEKWLLMIDNDMEPPLELPLLLSRHDVGVVGAPAMSVDRKYGPQLCFTVQDTNGNYRFPALRNGKIPAKGLIEVGHVGTGAILIRRDVLERFTFGGWEVYDKIEKAYNAENGEITLTRKEMASLLYSDIPFYVPEAIRRKGAQTGSLLVGEDIAFCNACRAKGIPMYVDLEAHCGHRKTMGLLWDEDLRDPDMNAEYWRLPARDAKKLSSL